MIIAVTCLIAIAVIAFILGVRPKDLPAPEPVSPFQHLDERKASIYENLRDLQFEYRVGKLSDADYQQTKNDLQKELAAVLAEVDRVRQTLDLPKPAKAAAPANTAPANGTKPAASAPAASNVCASCGAKFDTALKFCGECGKPMKVAQ